MLKKFKKKLELEDIIDMPNIAGELDDEDLSALAQDVIQRFEMDQESREDWERQANEALKLIELSHEQKNYPWPGASNVKYPLTATAVIQFAARQMPLLIRNGRVAEAQTIGKDPDGSKAERAARVSKHMSYQLLHEMDEWEDETDKMFHMLASVGTTFKKTYYCPLKRRPISQLCLYDEIFINNDVRNLDDARRITHRIYMHKNEIIEKMRLGIYSELSPDELDRETLAKLQNDKTHEILEQHRYLDLDQDGYEEPYVVLVDTDLGKVLRIVARFDEEDVELTEDNKILRITPIQYFSDFHFIRSSRGKFYSIGFGQLLFSLNHSVNTLVNQLIDAGTLANTQTGLIDKRLKLPGGVYEMTPGQFQKVNLSGIDDVRKHIMPLDFKEPSTVLFQLMGTLIEATKEVSSVSDATMGRESTQNVAATTMLAMIEQGNKVFSSIQKRIFIGLKKEFTKLFRLNRIYLDQEQYYRILDDEAVIRADDYNEADFDIMPVADPSISSDAHRVARTQAHMNLLQMGLPGVNTFEILKRYLEALETTNIDAILQPPDPNAPPPIEVLEKQSEIQERGDRLALRAKELELRSMAQSADMIEKEYKNKLNEALAIKALAEAEAAEVGQQLQQYKLELDRVTSEMSAKMAALAEAKNPETNFNEQDVQQVMGGMNEQPQQPEGLEGGGLPVEAPPGDQTPIEGMEAGPTGLDT